MKGPMHQCQEFGDRRRKGDARPLAGVSVLSFLQCSDIAGWVTGRAVGCKTSVPHIPEVSLSEEMERENCGEYSGNRPIKFISKQPL